jgi:hypothetical protein
MPVKDALSGDRISGAKAVPTNKESLSVKEADITEASLDSVAPSSRGFFPDFEGKTYRQIVRHVVEKHGASSYISRGTLFYPSGKPGRDNGYKLPDFAAKYYEELRNPTPPKQSLSVAPAIADPAIDVSTRTNQQLTHLSTNAEAAIRLQGSGDCGDKRGGAGGIKRFHQ